MTATHHRPDDIEKKILRAMMTRAAERGWAHASVYQAAEEAGVALSEARRRFPNKNKVLIYLGHHADQLVLGHHANGTPRERLFDLMMRRLDGFQEYREGVRAVLRHIPFDPKLGLMLAIMTEGSMEWMAEAAGMDVSGWMGKIRLKSLLALWGYLIRIWERDGSEDLAETMSGLDKALDRAERLGLLRSATSHFDDEAPASFSENLDRQAK